MDTLKEVEKETVKGISPICHTGEGSVKFLLVCTTDECHPRSPSASDRTTDELTEQKLQLSASCHGQGLLVLFERERGAIRKNKARHLSSTIAAGAFLAAKHIYPMWYMEWGRAGRPG